MSTDYVINRHNLQLANRFIEDSEPTIALYTDPNEAILQSKLPGYEN